MKLKFVDGTFTALVLWDGRPTGDKTLHTLQTSKHSLHTINFNGKSLQASSHFLQHLLPFS